MPAAAEALLKRLAWDDLDLAFLRRLVEMARDEDLAGLGLRERPRVTGDRSTASLPAAPRQGSADLVARDALTVCGLPLIPVILAAYGGGARVQPCVKDGRGVKAGDVLATLTGDPRSLLAAERVILNFIQRLSGIATQTHRYAEALGQGRTRLLDTRKTTPGYRMLEKYAVACGGGWNHRLGLFDRVMLKDNHLALIGFADEEIPGSKSQNSKNRAPASSPLAAAVARAKKAAPDLPVEVEVDRIDQIPPVLAAGADVILLDNFTPAQIKRAVALIGGRAFTEASGGITLKTLPRFAELGLDFISTGALVHQSVWVDIGLDWRA
ncbi:MAG: nicotinate-nucleotide diphosphorylase [Verrucomicrobia bacterium]|nr:nicotinate-nucleotide diphosphorylase [Verrucomicrobiota bacterium]